MLLLQPALLQHMSLSFHLVVDKNSVWQNYGPFTLPLKRKNNHSSIQVASVLFIWLVNTANYAVVLKS